VLASDIEVFREIGGEAALYFRAQDVSQMADGLFTLLSDDGLRSALVARGRERVMDFTWRTAARKLLRILAEVAQEGRVG
jgi:glycosyltransferase involved in cell wall biosynthesis